MDNLETYATDFAVENVKDEHGKEVPDDNSRMVRRNCVCHEHSGDVPNCHSHTYNPIRHQATPTCMEIDPRPLLATPTPEIETQIGGGQPLLEKS